MKKIVSARVIPNTVHPAVGSQVKIEFDDKSSTVVYQDTLLGLYNTDKELEFA